MRSMKLTHFIGTPLETTYIKNLAVMVIGSEICLLQYKALFFCFSEDISEITLQKREYYTKTLLSG